MAADANIGSAGNGKALAYVDSSIVICTISAQRGFLKPGRYGSSIAYNLLAGIVAVIIAVHKQVFALPFGIVVRCTVVGIRCTITIPIGTGKEACNIAVYTCYTVLEGCIAVVAAVVEACVAASFVKAVVGFEVCKKRVAVHKFLASGGGYFRCCKWSAPEPHFIHFAIPMAATTAPPAQAQEVAAVVNGAAIVGCTLYEQPIYISLDCSWAFYQGQVLPNICLKGEGNTGIHGSKNICVHIVLILLANPVGE